MDSLTVAPLTLSKRFMWELFIPDVIQQQISAVYPTAEIRQQMYYSQHAEKTKISCGVLTVENLVAVCYQPPQESVSTLEQINTFRGCGMTGRLRIRTYWWR